MKIDYREARALLRSSHAGALGTRSVSVPDYPFVSVVTFVVDGAGRPIFLISGLAEHTRNLLADPRASLLVTEGRGTDLSQARLTLLGRAIPAALSELEVARFLRYSPASEQYLQLGDFRFFRLEPERARFIGGFGRMGWIAATEPVWVVNPEEEAAILARLERLAPIGVVVLGMDAEALDVRIAGVFRRLVFAEAVRDAAEIESASNEALLRLDLPPSGEASTFA